MEAKLTPVKIGLTEMLDSLWEELKKASLAAEARGDGRFVFEEAEIEIAVTAEAETQTKFNLYVVELGAGVNATRQATVRVKIKEFTEEMRSNYTGRMVFKSERSNINAPDVRAVSPEHAEELARA